MLTKAMKYLYLYDARFGRVEEDDDGHDTCYKK